MKTLIKEFTLVALFLTFTTSVNAQNNTTVKNTCPCCTNNYTDFDFWVGKWYVTDTLGKQVGENTISKMQSNCILMEEWKGNGGSTGTSINYFDKSDSTWNQTWVDGNGGVLQLKGNLVNNQMVLKGKLQQGQTGQYYNQIFWTPNEDGTVTQLWEIFDADGNVLQTLFKGIYHRKED